MTIFQMMRARPMGYSGAPNVDRHSICSAKSLPIIMMICTVHFLLITMKMNASKILSIMSLHSITISATEMKSYLNLAKGSLNII